MDRIRFENLKADLSSSLTPEQCLEVRQLISDVINRYVAFFSVVERGTRLAEIGACPHCGNERISKDGKDRNGRQRFRCVKVQDNGCGARFNTLTGTPFARLRHPERWGAYADMMVGHRSISKILASGLLKSRDTALRWRHRFLTIPEKMMPERLVGNAEWDETYFRTSYKGDRGWKNGRPPENRRPRYRGQGDDVGRSDERVAVFTVVDSTGAVLEARLDRDMLEEAKPLIRGRMANVSIVCGDGRPGYKRMAKEFGAEFRRIGRPKAKSYLQKAKGGKPRRKGKLGLGRVNAHHERIKTFVNRQARGVSTRHLARYLGWLRFISQAEFEPKAFIETALRPLQAAP